MTETDWLTSSDPAAMLTFLQGRLGPRNLRLWAAGCCRLLGKHLDRPARDAIHVAEMVADGRLRCMEVYFVTQFGLQAIGDGPLRRAAAVMLSPEVAASAGEFAAAILEFAESVGRERDIEAIAQAMLLREVAGNPFRPVNLDGQVWRWQAGTVGMVAEEIYSRRTFDELPALADALEDAGCQEGHLLEHLRSGLRHVRGCWALDLLTGRGGEEAQPRPLRLAQ